MPAKSGHVLQRLGAALALGALLFLGGCSTISGAPPRLTTADVLADEDPDFYKAINSYYRQKTEDARVQVRNKFVETRIAVIDLEFLKFRQSLHSGRVRLDLFSDLGLMGLNAAGAAVSSTTAKTTYAMLSAALVGSKTSIDKNVYFERTVAAMLSQMDTLRNAQLLLLNVGLTQPISAFSISRAKAMTDAYYTAGTIAAAIQGVNAATAASAAASETALQEKIKGFLTSQGIPSTVADADEIGEQIEGCYSIDANRATINAELKELKYQKSVSEFTVDSTTRGELRNKLLKAIQAKGVCKD